MVSPNPRKSLLVINQYYYPDRASTGQLLAELCQGLAEHFDVTALVGTPSYSVEEKSAHRHSECASCVSKIKIKRVFNTSFKRDGIAGRLINYASFMLSALIRGILLKRHDLVIVMSDPPTVNFIGFLIKKLKGSKLVQICQDVYPEVAMALKKADNKALLYAFAKMNNSAQGTCDGLVAISEGMKKRLTDKGIRADKIAVIENWADTESIVPENKSNPFSRSLGIDKKFVVMHSGNIGLSQELFILIETAEIMAAREDIVFVIIGDGAKKDELVKKADEKGLRNVMFLPYTEKSELKYSLGSADVHFVSLKEGLSGLIVPSKIYGVMAAGKPVITCLDEGDDILRLVEENKFGYKACREPNSVAKGILYFYNDPKLKDGCGKRARQAVVEKNSKRIIIDRYVKYISEIMG